MDTSKISIRITGVEFGYNESDDFTHVNVSFTAKDPTGSVNLTGYNRVNADTYAGNESAENLKELMRQNLIDRLTVEVA